MAGASSHPGLYVLRDCQAALHVGTVRVFMWMAAYTMLCWPTAHQRHYISNLLSTSVKYGARPARVAKPRAPLV